MCIRDRIEEIRVDPHSSARQGRRQAQARGPTIDAHSSVSLEQPRSSRHLSRGQGIQGLRRR
eukprot:1874535-Pyramimonas_sp.AAC.1